MKNGVLRNLALMVADIICLATVLFLCVFGYKLIGIGEYSPERYLRLWPIAVIFIGTNLFAKTYHGDFFYPSLPISQVEEFRRLFLSAALSHLVLMAMLAFLGDNRDFSRVVIFCSGVLTAFLAQPARDLTRWLLAKTSWGHVWVMLDCHSETAEILRKELEGNPYFGVRAVCITAGDDKIVSESVRHGIRILISCQDEQSFMKLMPEYVKWFHHVDYLPEGRLFPTNGGHTISIGGRSGLELVNQNRMRIKRHEKLIIDGLLSAVAFVSLVPFFMIIPILIKCFGGKGPVLYRANRLGRFGKPMRVWKFRSMYADADKRLNDILTNDPDMAAEFARNFKLANDPRVTPLGKILRKTSLDEIPQLLNVFSGEMALVGPRPIVDAEKRYYGDDFDIFSSVKPGITGLWQCSGRSGTDYAQRVSLDVHYVLNWSPWMDVWIVLRTAVAVITMRGAC